MIAYLVNLLIFVGINAIVAQSLSILIGQLAVFSMAQAVFMEVGAYSAALIALHGTSNLILVILAAMLSSAVIGAAFAIPALRVKNEYFVIASLGVQQIVFTSTQNLKLTGGSNGISGIPAATLMVPITSAPAFLILTVLLTAGVWVMLHAIVRSPAGLLMRAIREDEIAARSLGKRVVLTKTTAIALSAGIAAIAGVLYAFYLTFIDASAFDLNQSLLVLAMVIIGGADSLSGAVLGAAIVVIAPNLLEFFKIIPSSILGPTQATLYGVLLVLMMMFRPQGLVGKRIVVGRE